MNARPHLLDDPWLAPYAQAIRARAAAAAARADELAPAGGSLVDFADAHADYGLHKLPRGGWRFREWAPGATAIWLVGDFSGWERRSAFALVRSRERPDVWEGRFPARAIRHGQYYRLDVTWPGGGGERLPSCARRVVQDSATHLFAAQVWNPPKPYAWRFPAWRRPAAAPLIYEAHVGMAQEEERVGTYAEFRDRILPRIKAAGYNTVQLMAVMEHPYYGSFGYHVSSFFAPSSRFGTPDDLKSLVDTAHGMGLAVIMDLVHSHAVKNERDGLSCFDGTDWQYFHDGPRGWHPAWDSRCFDYAKRDVLRFLLSNCRYWLEEFHFDGFRFDGVTSMLYRHHGLGTAFTDYAMYFDGSVDEDAWIYLNLANRVIHAVRPDALSIAEDVSGMPGCAAPCADGGLGFDLRLAMGVPDLWFKMVSEQRDDDWSMGGLWHELVNRRAEEGVVDYVESHDQALVGGKSFIFQMIDADMYYGMGREQHVLAVERGVALHKMARLATYATASPAYLAFMGNEFGHPEWIDFPRAENGWSCHWARRQWSLRDDPRLLFKCLGDFDAAMLREGTQRRILEGTPPVPFLADEAAKVLVFSRGPLLFAFNFHPTRSWSDFRVPAPPGRFRLVFDTDEVRFGGQGRVAPDQLFATGYDVRGDERHDHLTLYLPCRTALVLEHVTA